MTIRELAEIMTHKARADYWIGMAVSGVADQRRVYVDKSEMSQAEKRKYAMEIAYRHINFMQEVLDNCAAEEADQMDRITARLEDG